MATAFDANAHASAGEGTTRAGVAAMPNSRMARTSVTTTSVFGEEPLEAAGTTIGVSAATAVRRTGRVRSGFRTGSGRGVGAGGGVTRVAGVRTGGCDLPGGGGGVAGGVEAVLDVARSVGGGAVGCCAATARVRVGEARLRGAGSGLGSVGGGGAGDGVVE